MDRTKLWAFVVIAAAAVSGGCLERELVSLNPCLVSGVVDQVEAASIDKLDLLFVVDNSNSMREEQDALKQQFPRLINALTSGGTRADGRMYPPIKNMHLGVVSTDMGLVGVPNAFGCDVNGGDDGLLQHDGGRPGCKQTYPSFLSFELGTSNADEVASDFACIATLGTGGCGFEMPLEAALKALWPKQYVDAQGNAYAKNPISFVATTEDRTFGHGDVGLTQGGNGGFLRNDAREGVSLIAIVVVTDEEDCSSIKLDHFTTDKSKPISAEPLNLRCFNHKENLFKVQRYIDGFKALRPGNENLVIFAAIAGVPVDLVDAAQRARFSDLKDEPSRAAYYDAMLSDSRMQERPNGKAGNDANLEASCFGKKADGSDAPASPAVRLVEVARGFGKNGVIQSICQNDFGPAMDAIINAIIDAIPSVCLPKPLVKTSEGTVPCNVIWELPPADKASTGAPTDCEGPGQFLEPVAPNRVAINDRGGKNCMVRQLPVTVANTIPTGKGWYYDDFGPELQQVCGSQPQRISFTESAKPANGVVVKLECVNETQTLRSTDPRRLPDQANIGTPCSGVLNAEGELVPPDDVCVVQMRDGSQDRGMFCHADLNVCTRSCQGQSDCPAAWVCDDRPESLEKSGGRAFCVNPTCGSD